MKIEKMIIGAIAKPILGQVEMIAYRDEIELRRKSI